MTPAANKKRQTRMRKRILAKGAFTLVESESVKLVLVCQISQPALLATGVSRWMLQWSMELDDPLSTSGVNVINFFPSLLTKRPNKLKCLYLAITFQSSLTFTGNTRSLPKKEASERQSYWVGSGLALKL